MVQRTISRVAVPRIIHHRSVSKSIVWSSFSIIYYQNGHNLRVHPFSEHVFFFRTIQRPGHWQRLQLPSFGLRGRRAGLYRCRGHGRCGKERCKRWGTASQLGKDTWHGKFWAWENPLYNWAGGKGRFCRYLYVFLCWVLIFLNIFFGLASPFNEDLLREYGDFNGVFITFMMNKWWPNP